jgi:tRNA(fMet)-specific endonuclease VapC
MYLLDTNALSELLKKRPKPQFLTRLRRHPPEMYFTSSICVMELRNGSRRRDDYAVFWQRITHEVLSRVTILDFSVSEATVAGDILAHLARRGELIGVEDVLIGATALVREYTVMTGNVRHFERIPALHVENWLV